jgi:Clostripain family
MMQKTFLAVIILFTLLSCSPKEEADWTVLIYMAADNGLNEAAIEDIDEMLSAQFSDDIKVVVQIDESQYSESPAAKRYRIQPGNKTFISNLGEIDSGDFNVLTKFANWGFEKYPSDKKALFIWGHGNGWYNAYNRFCPDNESLKAISVPDGEFAYAIENINSHLDILVLDACNMLAVEVVNEVYEQVDFILGSETAICTDGFPYDETLPLFEEHVDTEALVMDMTTVFVNSYLPGGSQNPYFDPYEVSLAAVNTEEFSQLTSALSEFVNTWQDSTGTEVFEASRQNCSIEFNDLFSDIDIMDYFTKLQENAVSAELASDCEEILTLIDQVFVSHFYLDLNDISGTDDYPAGTATIWFPQNLTTFSNLYSEYEKMKFSDTGWLEFITNSFQN